MRACVFAALLASGSAGLVGSAAAQCLTGKLAGPQPFPGDQFGQALAGDDDELVVGGWLSASIFVLDDNGTPVDVMDDSWTPQTTLLSQDPNFSDDYGRSVWLDDDHLVVGAPTSGGVFGFGHGAAYIYRRVANGPSPLDDGWTTEAELLHSGEGALDGFGSAVCVSRDHAVIGAPGEHLAPPVLAGGTVHVVRRDDMGTPQDATDDGWVEETVLTTADPSAMFFGKALRIVGRHLVVGAPAGGAGAVYHFWRDDMGTADPADDAWIEHGKLAPPAGATVISFGKSLDFDGCLLAVGSTGKAYLFRLHDNGTPTDLADDIWTEEATLVPADPLSTVGYGTAVAVQGSLALVGDSFFNAGGKFGATFVFGKVDAPASPLDTTWLQVVKLVSPAPFAQRFGATVRLDGARAFIGETGNFASLGAGAEDAETGAVWPYAMAVAPWSFQDAALAGTGAPPCMTGAGALEAGAPTVVAMAHELALAPTALVIGLTALDGAFKGGVLVPQPDHVLGMTTDAAGKLAISAKWPPGIASGMEFYLQAWTADPRAPAGFSATNGVRGLTP